MSEVKAKNSTVAHGMVLSRLEIVHILSPVSMVTRGFYNSQHVFLRFRQPSGIAMTKFFFLHLFFFFSLPLISQVIIKTFQ